MSGVGGLPVFVRWATSSDVNGASSAAMEAHQSASTGINNAEGGSAQAPLFMRHSCPRLLLPAQALPLHYICELCEA